ncbi:hypothetical protein [Paraburkholderia sp. SIMBA_027]|uniref:hypothetical protein n=1 Tax=Paraburkholderia sp. SIMBA_027 TaxID=3085770 RepID=UPI003979665D
MVKLDRDLEQAAEDRRTALDALQECQQHSMLGMGCEREIDAYNLADEQYKDSAQQVEMFRTMTIAQQNARASELLVCR